MTPHEFIQKWQAAQLSERSACQQHFLDLCDLLGQPKPAAASPAASAVVGGEKPPAQSRRDCIIQPRVGRPSDLPWVNGPRQS